MSIYIRLELHKQITYITLICKYVQNSYSAKGLLAEICLSAIMVLMPVNQVNTAFEYAGIFVCWIILGSIKAQRAQLLLTMLSNIVIHNLHLISAYTYFI